MGSDSTRRSARRAAGHEGRIRVAAAPRIDDVAVIARLVRRTHGELVHVELAEHHGTIAPQIGGDGRFVGGLEAVEHMARRLGVDALGCEQVLDAERNAFQRPALAFRQPGAGGPRHGAGLVRSFDNIGIEHAGPLHRREIGIGQFKRRKVLAAKSIARGGNGEGGERGHQCLVSVAAARAAMGPSFSRGRRGFIRPPWGR